MACASRLLARRARGFRSIGAFERQRGADEKERGLVESFLRLAASEIAERHAVNALIGEARALDDGDALGRAATRSDQRARNRGGACRAHVDRERSRGASNALEVARALARSIARDLRVS